MPSLFMTSMITSVSLPPINRPNLPPEIRIDPGALQPTPLGLRHVKKPLPYSPPTIKPPAFRFGITTTQDALFKRSCGMPLSEAFIIAFKSSVAARSLAAADFCANAGTATKAAASTAPAKTFIGPTPLQFSGFYLFRDVLSFVRRTLRERLNIGLSV